MARCSLHNTTRAISTAAKVCPKNAGLRRALSTLNSANANLNNDGDIPPCQEPLTLLHKTTKLLPQVLGLGSAAFRESSLSIKAWENILSNVFEDLSSARQRPVRLTIHGVDGWSDSEDFVTSLLSNPLDSNKAQAQALKDRWKQTSADDITISYGPQFRAEGANIELCTPYLLQFPIPIEIVELRPSPSVRKHGVLEGSVIKKLFEADIPILLCNPLFTSIETLLSTPLPSNAIVIITSTPTQSIDLDKHLCHVPQHSPKPALLIADPKRASDAIDLLQSNPTSSSVVQRFQDAFNGSNISAVNRILESILQQPSRPTFKQLSSSNTLQTKLALVRLQDALSQCLSALSEIKHLLDAASIDASHLNDKLEEVQAKVEQEFLGPFQPLPKTSSSLPKPRSNEVVEAIRLGESQMKSVMSRFTWWKMILRVDEVTTLITAALQRTWCPELERKLLIHTGQLYSIQSEMTKASFNLISKHRILPTNVLQNSLMQLEASPRHRLTTSAITSPISSRRNQIIAFPTARLHVTAQRAVLGMTGGIAGGTGLGWVGWMGWLVGSGDGILGSLGMEPTTAMGVGALIAVASVRWAVGRWEKGRKKWWEDWQRVGLGLDRDLRTTLNLCMRQQVGDVAQAASEGLAHLIAQREKEVGRLDGEVRRLAAEVNRAMK